MAELGEQVSLDEMEKELRHFLMEMGERYKKAYDAESKPIRDQLVRIRCLKPPRIIVHADGTIHDLPE